MGAYGFGEYCPALHADRVDVAVGREKTDDVEPFLNYVAVSRVFGGVAIGPVVNFEKVTIFGRSEPEPIFILRFIQHVDRKKPF